MLSQCLMNLPREIIYSIFEYLDKTDIVYSFLKLNNYFSSTVIYFLGEQFDLTKINNYRIFDYCISTVLPLIGPNIRYLSIGYPYFLSNYMQPLENFCPNLDVLDVYCCSEKEDIRQYIAQLLHAQLKSLTLIFNGKIVGESISRDLLNRSIDERFQKKSLGTFLILHLSSFNDLTLLKRYCESNYLPDGLYMIECVSTGEWLTESNDDLCVMSKKFHREWIFSIKQINKEKYSLEYEISNEQTQRHLTVLSCCEDEERWISSSILSTQRKQSFQLCSIFTFEKIDNQNEYYIRPCYLHAKRLQLSGKRIIVSLCDNQNTINHRFRLHRIS